MSNKIERKFLKIQDMILDDLLSLEPQKNTKDSKKGFEISLVGGTVRDFFLGRKNKHDYDCEVRFSEKLNWNDFFLDGHIGEENLPYNIKRYRFKEFECEFSMPRVENFIEGDLSHKNFIAKFDPCLRISESAVRRDFTINAIYMTYKGGEFELNDPLMGINDIENKVLRPCSPDFHRDPVRILRAFRFQTLLNFDLQPDLLKSIKKHSLSFPAHYTRYEAEKSQDIILFLKNYNKIFLPIKWNKSLDKIKRPVLSIQELKNLVFLNEEQKNMIKSFFGLPDKFFPLIHFPCHFKGHQQFEDFQKAFPNDSQFKKISQLDSWAIEFLYSNGHIDLSLSDVEFVQSFRVDLDSISVSKRSAYRLFQGVSQIDRH